MSSAVSYRLKGWNGKIEDSPLNEHRTWWERYKRTYINIMPHFKYVLFKGLYVKEWHRERSTNYLVSTFGWKEICWIWSRQNLKQALCQLSICVSQVHFPLLLFLLSNSENYFFGFHCPLPCVWLDLASEAHWREMGGPEQAPPLPLLCWAAELANAVSPLWLQFLPDTSSMTSASIWWSWSWALGISLSFQPREDRGLLLMFILELLCLPLFGILALQLLKQQISCIKSSLSEISMDDFCLTAWTLRDILWILAQLVKNLPAVRETWVQFPGWEDPLEKGKAPHSSILAWRIPWTVQGVTKSWTRLSDFHFHPQWHWS